MSFFKKTSIFILAVALLLSISHDLSKSTEITDTPINPQKGDDIQIATIKIEPGDTLLSVVEEINSLKQLDVDQIIEDFHKLNPDTDYKALIPYNFYYFPLYNE